VAPVADPAPEPPIARHLILVLPFAALALGQIPLIFGDRNRMLLAGLGLSAVALGSLGGYGLPRTVQWIRSDYGHTIATVSAHARPGDGVLFYGPWQRVQYEYYEPDGFPPITQIPDQAPPQLVPGEAEPALQALLDSSSRVWVIPAAVDDVDPAHFVYGWLNAHAHCVQQTTSWWLCLPPAAQQALSLPLALRFGAGLELQRLESDALAVPAGEALRLTLTWVATQPLDGDVVLSLSLLDGRGNRWLQWEHFPGQWGNPPSLWQPGERFVDPLGLVVPPGAPAGAYTVRMTVVDAASGVALGPSDVELLTFQVTEPSAAPVLADYEHLNRSFTFESPDGESRIKLLGYELGGLQFQQGNPIPLRLHWLAPAGAVSDVELRLGLQRRSRLGPFAGTATPMVSDTLPLAPDYPLRTWSPGRVVSVPTALGVASDVPPGQAELTLSVHGSDGRPWTGDGGTSVVLGRVTIEERPFLRQPPSDVNAVEVDFADGTGQTRDKIGLRGYQIAGTVRPGGRLEVTYAWQALSRPERIYSVFSHLLTADGQKITQADAWPQGGVVLTTQWRPGEYIVDKHTIDIPEDAPPGPYLLAVGLYDAAGGDRLKASASGEPVANDQWLLAVPAE
jgi:hypothetical protein